VSDILSHESRHRAAKVYRMGPIPKAKTRPMAGKPLDRASVLAPDTALRSHLGVA
jgi:hypothetical protein